MLNFKRSFVGAWKTSKNIIGDHMKNLMKKTKLLRNNDGKVGVPILMYALGVPGFLVILLWLFFFKGK